jgi:hypothetical protein
VPTPFIARVGAVGRGATRAAPDSAAPEEATGAGTGGAASAVAVGVAVAVVVANAGDEPAADGARGTSSPQRCPVGR